MSNFHFVILYHAPCLLLLAILSVHTFIYNGCIVQEHIVPTEFTDSTIDITTPDSPEATSEDSTDDISSSSSSSLPSSSSSPVSVTGSQGTPTPTNGFVDDSYIAWVYLETMKPEEINQVKEVLQQHVADRANEYCQTEKCCPDSKEWIAGVTLDKQDVTIEVHSWVDGVTKVSVHIRLDHVCSSDSYIKTRTSSSELVFLPKEVLVTILQEELDKLNSTLHDCCTVSIISVKETGDEPSDKDQPDKPSGKMSKTWITAVVVIVVNAALVLIALSIALAIKRRMTRNEKQKIIMNMAPASRRRRPNNPYDTSFSSSALSSTYEIPYSQYDLPKSQYSVPDPYSYLDNVTNQQKHEGKREEENPTHFLYGFSDSHTSI